MRRRGWYEPKEAKEGGDGEGGETAEEVEFRAGCSRRPPVDAKEVEEFGDEEQGGGEVGGVVVRQEEGKVRMWWCLGIGSRGSREREGNGDPEPDEGAGGEEEEEGSTDGVVEDR